ncbi:MAG: nitroreductase [uncultured bacterium]|nr:MAG: nitroreductase [uncultured bacterium]HBY02612.1 NAD(P)H-dependent oxidoreductase [Rikenellaceae bacterium]
MNIIEGLKWRYATKIFDASKKVSKENLDYLKEAISLIPSSYGLQPYKVLVIENPAIREKLRKAAWGQAQLTEASHIFLFCNFTAMEPDKIDEFLNRGAAINNYDPATTKGYGDMMKGQMAGMTSEQIINWTSKQTYIALGSLLAAASELRIDSCPMEGFDKAKFDEILGLKEKGLTASVLGAVGYRSAEDSHQFLKKVRKPMKDLFEMI